MFVWISLCTYFPFIYSPLSVHTSIHTARLADGASDHLLTRVATRDANDGHRELAGTIIIFSVNFTEMGYSYRRVHLSNQGPVKKGADAHKSRSNFYRRRAARLANETTLFRLSVKRRKFHGLRGAIDVPTNIWTEQQPRLYFFKKCEKKANTLG